MKTKSKKCKGGWVGTGSFGIGPFGDAEPHYCIHGEVCQHTIDKHINLNWKRNSEEAAREIRNLKFQILRLGGSL